LRDFTDKRRCNGYGRLNRMNATTVVDHAEVSIGQERAGARRHRTVLHRLMPE
jgi:hypothetical protein